MGMTECTLNLNQLPTRWTGRKEGKGKAKDFICILWRVSCNWHPPRWFKCKKLTQYGMASYRTLHRSQPTFSARRESTHDTAKGGLLLTTMRPSAATHSADAEATLSHHEATLSHHPPRGPTRQLTPPPRRHGNIALRWHETYVDLIMHMFIIWILYCLV
jgi:hypothetical protein